MPRSFLIAPVSLVLLLGGCVAGGNDVVNTTSELESEFNSDLDGDGTFLDNGVKVAD